METLRSLSPPQAASITASAAVTIHFMLASRPLRCIFVFLSVLTAFDQFELVTVRVLHESDHRAAMLHRPGLARHFAAALLISSQVARISFTPMATCPKALPSSYLSTPQL